MTEPATALTDFLLSGLASIAAVRLLPRTGDAPLIGAPVFFAGFAAAAALGGIWHGFANDEISLTSRCLWWLTVVCTGGAAAGLAGVGLEGLGYRAPRRFLVCAAAFTLLLAVYAWFDSRFFVSVIATAFGSLLCLAGLAKRWAPGVRQAPLVAAAGVALSLAAGVLQQRGLAVDPVHFDHNATYHVILIPALALFYAGNRSLLRHA